MSTYPIIEAVSMRLLGNSNRFLATPPSQLTSCAEPKAILLSLHPVHASCTCPNSSPTQFEDLGDFIRQSSTVTLIEILLQQETQK